MLITTRNRLVGEDLAPEGSCVEVQQFAPQEASSLLYSEIKRDLVAPEVSGVDPLVDILGYIPLAITQAAAFIKRNKLTVLDYLASMKKDAQNQADHLTYDLRDHRRSGAYPNSVFRTWKLSFDQILKEDDKAASLLSLMAMLAPERIPRELLRKTMRGDIEFLQATGTLHAFALIDSEIGELFYAMHPFVRASVHYWLEERVENQTTREELWD